jgi:hypothetical protein
MTRNFTRLGDYLASAQSSYGFSEIIVEFGNESWNPSFRGGSILGAATMGGGGESWLWPSCGPQPAFRRNHARKRARKANARPIGEGIEYRVRGRESETSGERLISEAWDCDLATYHADDGANPAYLLFLPGPVARPCSFSTPRRKARICAISLCSMTPFHGGMPLSSMPSLTVLKKKASLLSLISNGRL